MLRTKYRSEKLKPETRRAKSGDGVGFLGKGNKPPHGSGVLVSVNCKLAQWGPERTYGKMWFWCISGLGNQVISTFHSRLAVFSFGICAKNFILQSLRGP